MPPFNMEMQDSQNFETNFWTYIMRLMKKQCDNWKQLCETVINKRHMQIEKKGKTISGKQT